MIQNLSKEAFFGGNELNSPGTAIPNNTPKENIGLHIFIGIVIGGAIVYVYFKNKDYFDSLIFKTRNKNTEYRYI